MKKRLSKLGLFQLSDTAQAAFVNCKIRPFQLRFVSRNNCSYCKQEQASVHLCEHELQNLLIFSSVLSVLPPKDHCIQQSPCVFHPGSLPMMH